MMAGETVSLQRMKARWTYSELRSPRLTSEYQDDPRVPPLCSKIQNVAFERLSAAEVEALAQIFEAFRGRILSHYWSDVQAFTVEEWSADKLGQVYAMSEVDPQGEGRYRPFAVYARSPRPTGADALLDPRVAADKVPLTPPLRAPDPLIVGLYHGFQVLIDGYFRGILFMRSAGTNERIAVLVPIARKPCSHAGQS
jgi:hypothetical protein